MDGGRVSCRRLPRARDFAWPWQAPILQPILDRARFRLRCSTPASCCASSTWSIFRPPISRIGGYTIQRPGNSNRFRQRLGRRAARARGASGAGLGLGDPAAGRTRAAHAGLPRLFRLALSAAVSVHCLAAGATALFGGLHRLGFGQFRALCCDDARDRRQTVRLAAWRLLFRWYSTTRWSGRTAFSPRR